MEDFIASTRHKATRGARVSSYFSFGLAGVFIVASVAFYFDTHSWPLTIFVGASGVGFFLAGIGYNRVAKRNSEHGAA
jgi:hypothetical protein